MASRAQRPVNVVFSIWDEDRNLMVVSSTDRKIIAELKRWAKQQGYRVEPADKEES